jgi:2-C-methyl-D-erythritol 4-phosphate cytidylyltransferase
VTPALVTAGLAAARDTGAAVPGVAVKDTIKIVGAGDIIVTTPDRSALRAIQTPQVFRNDLLVDAYARATGDVTDDASLL